MVGLTAFTNEIKPAARVARLVKALSPSIVTVIGGVHPSVLPERTLEEFPEFDYVVVGEGELTFAELVDALAAGVSPATIAGVCARDGEGTIRTPERPRVMDSRHAAAAGVGPRAAVRRAISS